MLSIGISSHPLGIIDHVIRFIVFFGLGGTAGGLATLFVGYPLELVCFNLSYGREQRRWFLAFAVPFVTVATYIALFTHRDSLFEPAANLLTLALPLSLTYCGIIFAFDKIITKFSKLQILHKQKHLE